MASSARVRLLAVDPDLGSLLTAEEFAEAANLAIPVVTVDHDDGLGGLNEAGVFGALVLEGLVLRQLRVADQLGMRLLGPGDILPLNGLPAPMLVAESTFRATSGTRLAILGREVLFAARQWPSLVAGLQLRAAQQADRLNAQLVICQLPRVDQRLLALLWLLAESWGRVTPCGTALPLKLTHEALGALIGARRPTVTLALRELAERGAVIRQDHGWLLLEPPPQGHEESKLLPRGAAAEGVLATWTQTADGGVAAVAPEASSHRYAYLEEAVSTLSEQHARSRDQFRERIGALIAAREQCREIRRRIASDRLSRQRRRAPSS